VRVHVQVETHVLPWILKWYQMKRYVWEDWSLVFLCASRGLYITSELWIVILNSHLFNFTYHLEPSFIPVGMVGTFDLLGHLFPCEDYSYRQKQTLRFPCLCLQIRASHLYGVENRYLSSYYSRPDLVCSLNVDQTVPFSNFLAFTKGGTYSLLSCRVPVQSVSLLEIMLILDSYKVFCPEDVTEAPQVWWILLQFYMCQNYHFHALSSINYESTHISCALFMELKILS
jgi:hypothetical protein